MSKYIKPFFPPLSALVFTFFLSCGGENNYTVDISGQKHDITIYRLDVEMFSSDTSLMKDKNKKFISDLGDLYAFYVSEMVQSGSVYDPAVHLYLNRFVTDSVMNLVVDDIAMTFGDFSAEKEAVDSLFKHFKYYFPNDNFPDTLVVYNSVFTNGVISTDSQIGLGAEMYLGAENRVVKLLPGEPFPVYFRNKMDRKFIVRDIAESWLSSHYIDKTEDDFFNHLIYHGKIQYALNLLLPNYSDALRMRFFEDEWQWCEDNEAEIWKHLVDQKWIYTNDFKVIRNFFYEAPFTAGLPEGAPAKVGIYMGKKIVESYMNENEELSLKELIDTDDSQKILKAYKPE